MWSLAVVMWEILSFAALPFAGLINRNNIQSVRKEDLVCGCSLICFLFLACFWSPSPPTLSLAAGGGRAHDVHTRHASSSVFA
jgi:hypothetical protein